MRKATALLIIVVIARAMSTDAVMFQSPSTAPSFEVASIRPNRSGGGPMSMGFVSAERFTAKNASLRELIALAYGTPQPLPNFQIIGATGWMLTDRFDVEAKAEPGSPPESRRFLLRTLLADRFNLTTHTEARELPIYVLVVGRADGALGPQLHRAAIDCAALRASGGNTASAQVPPPPGQRPSCGIGGGLDRILGGDATMAQFVTTLSRRVNRVVVDKTGLVGGFDLEVVWTPDQVPNPPPADLPPPAPFDPNGPSIFTALQEQLGLKLESTRGPVDVVIIDRVDRLTPD